MKIAPEKTKTSKKRTISRRNKTNRNCNFSEWTCALCLCISVSVRHFVTLSVLLCPRVCVLCVNSAVKVRNSYENVERQPGSNVHKSLCHRQGLVSGNASWILASTTGIDCRQQQLQQLPSESQSLYGGPGHPGGHRPVQRQPGPSRRPQVPHVRPVQRGCRLHYSLH